MGAKESIASWLDKVMIDKLRDGVAHDPKGEHMSERVVNVPIILYVCQDRHGSDLYFRDKPSLDDWLRRENRGDDSFEITYYVYTLNGSKRFKRETVYEEGDLVERGD